MPRSACLSILVVPASASESDLVCGWRETRGIIFLLLLLLRPLQDDGAEGVCLSVPPSLPRWRDVLHLCTRTPTPPLFACVRVGIGACLPACLPAYVPCLPACLPAPLAGCPLVGRRPLPHHSPVGVDLGLPEAPLPPPPALGSRRRFARHLGSSSIMCGTRNNEAVK